MDVVNICQVASEYWSTNSVRGSTLAAAATIRVVNRHTRSCRECRRYADAARIVRVGLPEVRPKPFAADPNSWEDRVLGRLSAAWARRIEVV